MLLFKRKMAPSVPQKDKIFNIGERMEKRPPVYLPNPCSWAPASASLSGPLTLPNAKVSSGTEAGHATFLGSELLESDAG